MYFLRLPLRTGPAPACCPVAAPDRRAGVIVPGADRARRLRSSIRRPYRGPRRSPVWRARNPPTPAAPPRVQRREPTSRCGCAVGGGGGPRGNDPVPGACRGALGGPAGSIAGLLALGPRYGRERPAGRRGQRVPGPHRGHRGGELAAAAVALRGVLHQRRLDDRARVRRDVRRQRRRRCRGCASSRRSPRCPTGTAGARRGTRSRPRRASRRRSPARPRARGPAPGRCSGRCP